MEVARENAVIEETGEYRTDIFCCFLLPGLYLYLLKGPVLTYRKISYILDTFQISNIFHFLFLRKLRSVITQIVIICN